MLYLKNIKKYFNKGTNNEMCLFKDLDLQINDGDFISIIGGNGSGKTTLLNIISGNMLIDKGKILLNDKDITLKKDYERAKNIGVVYQNPEKGTCSTMTILENLSLANNKGKKFGLNKGINEANQQYYYNIVKDLNLGLEKKLNVLVRNLSGGQRQALALLMATMTPIDFLLLDEHTAALDPKTASNIMNLTNKIVKDKGITTIMVTHNLKFAIEYGDRLIMMNQGEIILDKKGKRKQNLKVEELLLIFNKINNNVE